jgi:NAD(P)-dependent dehydrogenase (short-subunit alcohol dehydrogenase family)
MQHVTMDVTDTGQISSALARVLSGDGRIDILVNNAGFIGGTRSVEELDPADWRRIIDVNLTGVFEVSRQVVPVMRRAGWGRIVNMASLAGKEGTPGLSAYSAAKAGVIAFTKSLGKRVGEHRDTGEQRCSGSDRDRHPGANGSNNRAGHDRKKPTEAVGDRG